MGGYLWCRQRKSNGMRNPFYDAVWLVRNGDIILAYRKGAVRAVGIVLSAAEEAPDPAKTQAGVSGWLARVGWLELKQPLTPAAHMDVLAPLLPAVYSPLSPEGRGLQGGRLMPVPPRLARALIQLAGGTAPEYLAAPDRRSRQMRLMLGNEAKEEEQ